MTAVEYRQAEIVQLLLERESINLNIAGYYKQTILSFAAQHGKARVVYQLLGYKTIDPNQADCGK